MDCIELLNQASNAGITTEVVDGDLRICGSSEHEELVEQLRTRKHEILVELGAAPPADEEWPEPLPLPDQLPDVAPFDFEMLPNCVRAFVEDVAERMQCPADYPGISIMITLAGVLGRKVGVRPRRRDDWLVIANLWGMAVGRPGLMKSPAVNESLKPLKRLEIEAKCEFDTQMSDYLAAEMVAKAKRQKAEQDIKQALKNEGDPHPIAAAALAEELQRPTRRRYQVNDPTVEKLGEILNENPNGVVIVRDELYAWLKSLDKDGHELARGFYLEAWNGNGRYAYDRIARGTIDIEAAIISLIGTIQPSRLAEYVRAAVRGGAGDDGLIQRLQLAVWPDCPTAWVNVDRWPDSEAKIAAWEAIERLDLLQSHEVGAVCGDDDEVPFLRFSPEAQELFNEWLTALEHRLRSEELSPAFESHLAKYRSLIPSLALLIHLADSGVEEIAMPALEKAIRWSEYLESHANRIYSLAVQADLTTVRLLAKKIRDGSLQDGFVLRDIYRPCWSGLSDREDVKEAVERLLDLGWLDPDSEQTGGKSKRTFRINPRVYALAP